MKDLAELPPIGQGRSGRIAASQVFAENGGALVLYSSGVGSQLRGHLYWISLEDGSPYDVPGLNLDEVSHVQYVRSGHLVMRRGTSLVALPFDLDKLEVAGPEITLEQDVRSFVVSDTGTLAYLTQGDNPRSAPAWVDTNGRIERLTLPAKNCPWPFDLSPDGKTIALTCDEDPPRQTDIWLADLETERLFPFSFDGTSTDPLFTPDGTRIVYTTRAGDARALVWAPTDGSGPVETLLESPYEVYPQSWHPDGEILAYLTFHPETHGDIWLLRPGDEFLAEPFLASAANETGASFSPDGNLIGYHRTLPGLSYQAFVRPFPAFDPAKRVSRHSGGWPMWSEDGRTIWYRQRVGLSMFSIALDEGPGFSPQPPVLAFPLNARSYALTRTAPHSIEPGGERFLMMEIVEPRREIHVVQSWFEELKQRVPRR